MLIMSEQWATAPIPVCFDHTTYLDLVLTSLATYVRMKLKAAEEVFYSCSY